MENVNSPWVIGLEETLFITAVILLISDIFFQTDIVIHIACVIFAYLISTIIDVHFIYQVLIGLTAWFFIIGFHYFVWRTVIQKILNSIIAPTKYVSGTEGLLKDNGVIKVIDGRIMVEIKGDIWPCEVSTGLTTGEQVQVICVKNGILTVIADNGSNLLCK